MPTDRELNARDAKLVMWLSEAHAKEAELEADLTAHIALTEKAAYKKRLQTHLKETKEHKRATERRIKQLGGQVTSGVNVPGVPGVIGETAGKTVAAVKGQVGTARALLTTQPETHLRNAQEELREEHVEIAIYTRIETLATEVGDRESAQLARRIRRDEERMAKYLSAELERLVKDVVRSEIPRDQRAKTTRRRSSSSSSSRRSSSSRSSSSRSGSSRSSSRSGNGSSGSSGSRSGSSRSGSSRSSGSRSGGSRSGGSRSSNGGSSGGRSSRRATSGARS